MKAEDLKCNGVYWSTRHKQCCKVIAIARYLVELEFENHRNTGWYHCQEIEELPPLEEKVVDISSLIR